VANGAGCPPAGCTTTGELRVSASADRSASTLLDGRGDISGNAYVFTRPETGVTRVLFWLDDPARSGPPRRTEAGAPYDFAGTNADATKTAVPFNTTTIANGQHTITAQIDYSSGSTEVVTATFAVDNATGCPATGCPTIGELRMSTSPDRSGSVLLNGRADVAGDIYVFSKPDAGVSQVRFFLDDTGMINPPYRVETGAPWDLVGTNVDAAQTAKPFRTKSISNGQHTLTAAIDYTNGSSEVVTATFAVDNPTVCAPLTCEEVKVDIPFDLDFTADRGGVDDTNGVGTGFTWIDYPANGPGYVPSALALDEAGGMLHITTAAGLNSTNSNSQQNAIGVGIDGPNQVSVLSTTIVNPPAGTGQNQQAGLWFGVDSDNYLKVNVISTSTGTRIQAEMEVDGARSGSKFSTGNLNLTTASVRLFLRANPEDRTVKSSYSLNGGPIAQLGTHTAPPEFFSFDGAGIDPRIGTRTFAGIFASHRSGPAPLVYSFDDFTVTNGAVPPTVSSSGFNFTRAAIPVPMPTSMVMGPDGKLYVSELLGKIHRLTLGPDKQVVSDEVISTLGSRLTLGLTVDPASTASNVALYVAHSSPSLDNGEPNSGMVTRLSGANLGTRQDVITGLPRAKANHGTNSIHFGPDGKLYIAQGGNTGAGAPNSSSSEFGTMEEQPLSAGLLVANVNGAGFDGSCANSVDIFGPPPCDVQTYATGLRNTYDFVFHSNGGIYGPDNGLGVEGTFPPSPTPPCFGFASTAPYNQGGHNPGQQPDVLNKIEQGRYYGHPNPYRSECVFGSGFHQGVSPLPNYKAPALNLGDHRSANGTIEYNAPKFCGDLNGEVLITNYSLGDNVTRSRLSADGQSVASHKDLAGGFRDPLPIAQGPDGTIYVGEFGASKVTALIPVNGGCWSERAPLPENLLDVSGAALGGKLYAVAGKVSSAGHQTKVWVYDPATDAWSSAAPLPGPGVENPAVVATGGRLYAFGGSTDPFAGAVTNAAVYDPTTNAWTALPPMATGRGGAVAQAINGKIYVAGGLGANGASLASVEVFDIASRTWSSAAPMLERRDNPGVGVAAGKLYVFGGRTRNADGSIVNGTLATTEMYDPATNSWIPKAPMPTGRRTFMVGYLNSRFQVMGGEATPAGGAFPQNEEYDPVTDTWRSLRDMRTPRHGGAAGTIAGQVFVAGGGVKGGFSVSNVNEVFEFRADG
jgi:glucose/arabinose dehydrogenase/N-acetylneuraminic acid mutarotase